jgi:HlyD family secretion protein
VKADAPLFVLESAAEQAAVTEAEKRVAQTRARLENLLKGRRPTEIAALEARAAQNRATLELAESELARSRRLQHDQVIAAAELDVAVSRRDAAQAALEAAVADLGTARLGGREDEVRAAEAEQAAAEASLVRARWTLDQKTQRSPIEARVHDTYHEPGEFVAAGSPVVALLPPSGLKVRFFVPQADLPHLAPGTEVDVFRDGTNAPLRARIAYLSTRPEFTPPVIYSRSTRAKLVFLVEATLRPEDTAGLGPGQPVDVRPAAPAP